MFEDLRKAVINYTLLGRDGNTKYVEVLNPKRLVYEYGWHNNWTARRQRTSRMTQ